MKTKTFLILWVIGFLFVAPKWMPATATTPKAKDLLPSRSTGIEAGKSLSFFSIR
ncbi:hypothetical protein SAMN05444156_2267 [Verrucomicrobium sp. GAS474]|uniref:hypothetical protein n=1 Tax=Verrucomicrobium sp. GAS474 TaxID=1882831 RepID=UPI00087C0B8E|nr:hypothetical protein [Verrucomicrobium sp. GAS474]SDU15142.1 hypothetical protein SAMN05444156_2267 [Verrucomicrobium sp. GAS474]